jgi:hypothetical protein
MVNRWPDHPTFSVELPDRIDLLACADILLSEVRKSRPEATIRFEQGRLGDVLIIDAHDAGGRQVENIRITSLQMTVPPKNTKYIGSNSGEGRLTRASRKAMKALLGRVGGRLLTRGARGTGKKEVSFDNPSNDIPALSPFFTAILKLEAITPLSAACEIAKIAEIAEERDHLLQVVREFSHVERGQP